MNLTIQGSVGSFLIAVLVYFLVGELVNLLVKEEPAKKTFKVILLIGCVLIAVLGSVFIKL